MADVQNAHPQDGEQSAPSSWYGMDTLDTGKNEQG
jgi:hypothetical protein